MESENFGFVFGEPIKIEENQIYFDDSDYKWVVEKFEYSADGTDFFSIIDAFDLLADAIDCALCN